MAFEANCRHSIEFLLNGSRVTVDHYKPQTTLLDFIRAQGLTGAKEGCAEGECGACTVVTVAAHESGCAYRTVNSCLIFLPMASGREIYTVEALAREKELHPVQREIANRGGSQCGYCTPGFVMSLFAEHYRPDRQGPCDVDALAGNLCRCTGYRPIRDAAQALGPAPVDAFRDRLGRPAERLGAIVCQQDTGGFYRPESLARCFELLAAHTDARIVAGATDMAVESNLHGRRFPCLIAIEAIPELRDFRESESGVEIGAALTLSEIGAHNSRLPVIFRQWLPLFASPQIRNCATLGGNLATASPIGDAAPMLLALDANLRIASAAGERRVAVSSFFQGYRRTLLSPHELVISIEIPKPFPTQARFFKAAKRRLDDISTLAAGFALNFDAAGRIEKARLAYGGVAETPMRAVQAEAGLIGRLWSESTVRRAQDVLAQTLRPIGDHRGSANYRLVLAQKLLEKFWWESRGECSV